MTVDVLAIGAHPDDVELGCGGTLAGLTASGRAVAILHLTRGERGTRGTPEERIAEAERAGTVLGAAEVIVLDCGDGGLRRGEAQEDALIAELRRLRPEIVLGPPATDRHPDHRRAHHLVVDACFYAGLRRRGSGDPHRPAALFSYMQHDPFVPSFIVDVTASWEKKQEALGEYRSQLYQPGPERGDPETKVASRLYKEAMEGRARHYGMLIGAEYGEAFWSRLPLAVPDLLALTPGGLR